MWKRLLVVSAVSAAMSSMALAAPLTVGFSQVGSESGWRAAETNVAKSEAEKRGITLKIADEAGEDAKLIAVPHTKLSKEYDHIKDVNDLPELLKAQIAHFFEHYKDLEKGKWVKVEGWENAEAAKAEIVASFERAKNK